MNRLLSLGLALLVPFVAMAQTRKTPVSVMHIGKDPVGALFVEAFERDIARSTRYELMKGPVKGFQFYVDIITTDAGDTAAEQGKGSVVSVVIEDMGLPDSFPVANMWYHKAFIVDRRSADQIAGELLEDMDAGWCRYIKNFITGCPKEKLEPHRFPD
ncbi:MAG: hypothetical protein ACLP3K_17515 [Candidatus Acidiferrales bacterium]